MSSLLLLSLLSLLFCIFANKKQLAVQYYWHLLCIEQVEIPWPPILLLTLPPPIAAGVPPSSSLVHISLHPIPSSKCLSPSEHYTVSKSLP